MANPYQPPRRDQQEGNPFNGAPRYHYNTNGYNRSSDAFNNGGQPQQPFSNIKEEWEDGTFRFPWWAILGGAFVWFPSCIIMAALNYAWNRRDEKRNPWQGQPSRQTRNSSQPIEVTFNEVDGTYSSTPKRAASTGPVREAEIVQPDALAAEADRKDEKKARIRNTIGMILGIVGGVALASTLGDDVLRAVTHGYEWTLYIEDIIFAFLMTAGGAGLCYNAQKIRTGIRMRRKIKNIVGDAKYMNIDVIAAAISCSYEKCCAHLENCIEKHVFGDRAYIDHGRRCLVISELPPEEKKAETEKADDQPKAEETADTNQYTRILRQLREINDAIPDAVMTDKIDRLEKISAKIFQQAEQNPDKLPQMRRFMDYYLPTAMKLLQAYAELDSQGVEGENIGTSKRRIEQTMDMLVVAFERQLDQLFESDAMDLSTDISVMEQMLKADGLSGEDPFKAK